MTFYAISLIVETEEEDLLDTAITIARLASRIAKGEPSVDLRSVSVSIVDDDEGDEDVIDVPVLEIGDRQ